MADYRTIPAAELGKGSNIKVELCETEVDLYWKMAIEVLELIQENNAKGEKTVMIVPYGCRSSRWETASARSRSRKRESSTRRSTVTIWCS